jgi:hypothetical protein
MRKYLILMILFCLITGMDAQRKYKKKQKNPNQNEAKTEISVEKTTPAFRKLTFYGSISRMFMSEDSYTGWQGMYFTFENNNSYYTSQRLLEEKVKFQPFANVQAGILRNVALKNKFQISYGFGLETFSFKYKKEYTKLEERIIDHVQILNNGTPSETVITHINDPIQLYDDDYSYYTNNEIEYSVGAVHLPLRLSYLLFPSFYVHTQLGLTLPILTISSREIQTFGTINPHMTYKRDGNDVKISRVWGQVGVGIQYRVVDQISINFDYKLNTNSMMVVEDEPLSYGTTFERNSVKMKMISIGLGLNF